MLHFPESRIVETSAEQSAPAPGGLSVLDLEKLLAAFRRQIWVLLAGAVLGIALGIAYMMTAVPLYTASAELLIDKDKSRTINELSDATDVLQDDAEILSQVELLKSVNMALAVSDKLKLTQNEEFMAIRPSLLSRGIAAVMSLRSYFPSLLKTAEIKPVEENADNKRSQKVAAALASNIDVRRVGKTYVLSLSYTSVSPALATQITQGYASAYLEDQLNAKYDATRRASDWLQGRIAELKAQAFNADFAVQEFRRKNNLIATGGQLVSDRNLAAISEQLIGAQAASAEAKARVDQIEALIESGRTDAVVNDSLLSSTINKLRDQYLSASQLETEITKKLGPKHIQAVRLRAQMAEYQNQIFQELGRIAESYRSSYNVALSRQQSLEQNLTGALDVTATANTTQVTLRELEREAETFKALYDNFLQRYQETIQQQSFPITEARVITAATVPERPSAPKKPLVLAVFTILGLGIGTGLAAMREHRERFFRVGDQVRSELRQEFLGYIPMVAGGRAKSGDIRPSQEGAGLWTDGSVNAYVRSHPMSSLAEALRNVKVATDLSLSNQPSKVVGIVSCLPGEGKTTTASNFSILLAMQGAKTLLIDGDLRNPGVTRSLQQRPASGLMEAVMENGQLQSYLKWDETGRLAVLPAILKRRVSHSSELLTSPGMSSILTQARAEFGYIVVDLPPLGPIIDAKAFAPRVDAFILVVEWGRTSRHLVRSILSSHPGIRSKCLGVLLTKVNESKMRFYRSYGSSEYYSPRYQNYYID